MKKKEYKQENQELKQRVADLEKLRYPFRSIKIDDNSKTINIIRQPTYQDYKVFIGGVNIPERISDYINRIAELEQELSKSQTKHQKATSWATEFKNNYIVFRDTALKLEQENSELKIQNSNVVDRNFNLNYALSEITDKYNELVKVKNEMEKELESYKERFDTNEYIANFNEMMKNYLKLVQIEQSKSASKFPKAGIIDTSQKEVVFNTKN